MPRAHRHFIIRTAWVYGAKGKGNFVKTMLRLGADREELQGRDGSNWCAHLVEGSGSGDRPTRSPTFA